MVLKVKIGVWELTVRILAENAKVERVRACFRKAVKPKALIQKRFGTKSIGPRTVRMVKNGVPYSKLRGATVQNKDRSSAVNRSENQAFCFFSSLFFSSSRAFAFEASAFWRASSIFPTRINWIIGIFAGQEKEQQPHSMHAVG